MSEYSEKRDLVYWSKLYLTALEHGENYEKARKTICIWILDGEKYDFPKYHSKWHITEDELGIKGCFKDFEIHIIELKKLKRCDIIKTDKKGLWLSFLDYSQMEMIKMGCENYKAIKAAKEELDKMIASEPGMLDLIVQEEMNQITENTIREGFEEQRREIEQGKQEIEQGKQEIEQGKQEIEQGKQEIEQGKQELEQGKQELEQGKQELEQRKQELEEKIIETVKKMKTMGLTLEQIKEITKLSEEEIEKI